MQDPVPPCPAVPSIIQATSHAFPPAKSAPLAGEKRPVPEREARVHYLVLAWSGSCAVRDPKSSRAVSQLVWKISHWLGCFFERRRNRTFLRARCQMAFLEAALAFEQSVARDVHLYLSHNPDSAG